MQDQRKIYKQVSHRIDHLGHINCTRFCPRQLNWHARQWQQPLILYFFGTGWMVCQRHWYDQSFGHSTPRFWSNDRASANAPKGWFLSTEEALAWLQRAHFGWSRACINDDFLRSTLFFGYESSGMLLGWRVYWYMAQTRGHNSSCCAIRF